GASHAHGDRRTAPGAQRLRGRIVHPGQGDGGVLGTAAGSAAPGPPAGGQLRRRRHRHPRRCGPHDAVGVRRHLRRLRHLQVGGSREAGPGHRPGHGQLHGCGAGGKGIGGSGRAHVGHHPAYACEGIAEPAAGWWARYWWRGRTVFWGLLPATDSKASTKAAAVSNEVIHGMACSVEARRMRKPSRWGRRPWVMVLSTKSTAPDRMWSTRWGRPSSNLATLVTVRPLL